MKIDEHEMIVLTTKGPIPQSQLAQVNRKAEKAEKPCDRRINTVCPIKGLDYDSRCMTTCGLYGDGGCMLAGYGRKREAEEIALKTIRQEDYLSAAIRSEWDKGWYEELRAEMATLDAFTPDFLN